MQRVFIIDPCEKAFVGWDSMRKGLNRTFKKLCNLKTFSKMIYLKFKTWITKAIMLVYKSV